MKMAFQTSTNKFIWLKCCEHIALPITSALPDLLVQPIEEHLYVHNRIIV